MNHIQAIESITRKVAFDMGVDYDDLFTASRKHDLVLTRQISMLLIREKSRCYGVGCIGNFFAGRAHSTVIRSIQTVSNLMKYDENLRAQVAKLRQII